jgi:hypothetical protein
LGRRLGTQAEARKLANTGKRSICIAWAARRVGSRGRWARREVTARVLLTRFRAGARRIPMSRVTRAARPDQKVSISLPGVPVCGRVITTGFDCGLVPCSARKSLGEFPGNLQLSTSQVARRPLGGVLLWPTP